MRCVFDKYFVIRYVKEVLVVCRFVEIMGVVGAGVVA